MFLFLPPPPAPRIPACWTRCCPLFEEETGIQVDVVAVGTGQALKLGEDGNADVVLVHARSLEDAFMAAGHGVRREDVMYNDFVILGPEADPAGIAGGADAAAAMAQIAAAEATFVSRGDNSGTHAREKQLLAEGWHRAWRGVVPVGRPGHGRRADHCRRAQAYTLSDRGTYLARTLEGIDLNVLVEGDPGLSTPTA